MKILTSDKIYDIVLIERFVSIKNQRFKCFKLILEHYPQFKGKLSLWRTKTTGVVKKIMKQSSMKKEFCIKL